MSILEALSAAARRDAWEAWPDPMTESTTYARTRRLGRGLPRLQVLHELQRHDLLSARDVATVIEHVFRSTGEYLNERERVVRGRLMQHVRR